jgi:hypothetical protein
MPCEHAEQPLSRSALKDTDVPALMEIMMAGSPEDIYLFACNLQSPGDTWRLGSCPEPWGHVAAPVLPRAESGSSSHGDTWRPRSCPESGAGARAAGTRGSPGAAPSREWEPEPRGHVVASELPSAERWKSLS